MLAETDHFCPVHNRVSHLAFALIALHLGACGDDSAETEALDMVDDRDAGPADAGAGPDGSSDRTHESGDFVAADGEALDPLEWPVAELGPFNVGYRAWDIVYQLPAGGGERRILFNLWYPTRAESGPPAIYQGIIRDPGSVSGAELAEPAHDGRYPVLVHSHGFQSFGGGSAYLMRWFASHGWVAVAPDHTGNTLSDHRDPLATSHFLARPLDISRVLDELAELPEGDPLAGLARADRVVLSGHSFGAYTTWAAAGARFDPALLRVSCEAIGGALPSGECTEAELERFDRGLVDERVRAVIPMAGTFHRGLFGETGERGVEVPVLYLSGSLDNAAASADQFERLEGPDFTWVELEGGCHESFGLESCGHLDVALSTPIIGAYTLAFARHHLLFDRSARTLGVLDGTIEVAAEATVRRN